MTHRLSVLVVGRGRLGVGLARALRSAGAQVVTWAGRGKWPRAVPEVDAIVLAVPDRALASVVARIAPSLAARGAVLLTASGASGPDALPRSAGVAMGVMHPLASIAGSPAPSFDRTTFVIDGDAKAVAVARRIARTLGARPLVRALHGARYHAAAALVANAAAALATRAVEVLEGLGVGRRDAERAVGGLLGTVGENVASLGVPRALTGPIVRGDAETVRRHRAALRGEALRAYDAVAPLVLETARAAGLTSPAARAVEDALTDLGPTRALSPRRRTARSQRA